MIEKYGGWTVTGKGLNSWTVQEKMGHIQRELNVHSLLFASVGTDDEDSTRNILTVGKAFIESLNMHECLLSRQIPGRNGYQSSKKKGKKNPIIVIVTNSP